MADGEVDRPTVEGEGLLVVSCWWREGATVLVVLLAVVGVGRLRLPCIARACVRACVCV